MDDVEPVVEGVGLILPPPVVDPDDPLLIAQTLTYVTDDGSVLLSFTSAPFSFGEIYFTPEIDMRIFSPQSTRLFLIYFSLSIHFCCP